MFYRSGKPHGCRKWRKSWWWQNADWGISTQQSVKYCCPALSKQNSQQAKTSINFLIVQFIDEMHLRCGIWHEMRTPSWIEFKNGWRLQLMSMQITILQDLTGVVQSRRERREEDDLVNRLRPTYTRWEQASSELCERCLLITETPKTPGHYRYLIWVLDVKKPKPYGTRRAVDGRHVEWKGGERHSRVPDTSERAQLGWKGWQNPRRHLSDWQLADKFELFRPPILIKLLVMSAARARFWARRMVAMSEVQAMCMMRLCGVVKDLARTFTWCNEVKVSSAQCVEEGAERRMYNSSHWVAWFSPIWIWSILVD